MDFQELILLKRWMQELEEVVRVLAKEEHERNYEELLSRDNN